MRASVRVRERAVVVPVRRAAREVKARLHGAVARPAVRLAVRIEQSCHRHILFINFFILFTILSY
jgi:hypothetical protein